MVKRGPGRPAVLDRRTIAEAVLEIGFQDLTFAMAAERLGVAKATLYRYAANRDELVRLGLDLALRRVEWPDLTGDWHDLLRRWAMAFWRAWQANPGAVFEVSRGVLPPCAGELCQRLTAALVERGFEAHKAVLVVDLVFDLAADSRRGVETSQFLLQPSSAPTAQQAEAEWTTRIGVVLTGVARELAP